MAGDRCQRLRIRLEENPNDFSGWLELARSENAAQQAGEALGAATNALTLQPSSLEALYEKGVALLELGLAEESVGIFASLMAIQPLHPGVLVSLGSAFSTLRRFDQAGVIWEQAVRVAPDPVGVLEDLALCYQRMGDFQRVAEVWERVLVHDSCHPLALHHLAALGRRPAPDRSSEEYVVKLFDAFAEDFDATLGSLGYDGPRLLAAIVAKNASNTPGGWRILDAGCGTGLCAAHLRSWAAWLEGVDLSPGMLEKARARHLYDELHCEEMTRFCSRHPLSFDLVVAGDSINYSGNLEPFASGIAGSLRAGGRFAFFVERMEGENAKGFRLERHGRYSHRSEYVADCVAAAGLRIVDRSEAPVRSEAGKTVVATFFLTEGEDERDAACS